MIASFVVHFGLKWRKFCGVSFRSELLYWHWLQLLIYTIPMYSCLYWKLHTGNSSRKAVKSSLSLSIEPWSLSVQPTDQQKIQTQWIFDVIKEKNQNMTFSDRYHISSNKMSHSKSISSSCKQLHQSLLEIQNYYWCRCQ